MTTVVSGNKNLEFVMPPQEEMEAREFLSKTLNDKITRTIFLYLFNVDRPFGANIEELVAQRTHNFNRASNHIHSSLVNKYPDKYPNHKIYPNEGRPDYSSYPAIDSFIEFLNCHLNSLPSPVYIYRTLDVGGGSGEFGRAFVAAQRNINVHAHTLSASDLRTEELGFGKKDHRYHICDLANVLTYSPFNNNIGFDSITGDLALEYLEDNARNLATAFSLKRFDTE